MIPQSIVEAVLDATDIKALIEEDLPLKRRGANYVACCPIHKEDTPSFTVQPVKGIFKCFGCGVGGDAIKYLKEARGMSFEEAVRYLAGQHGIQVEDKEEMPEEIQERAYKQELFNANKIALDFFKSQLLSDNTKAKLARDYAVKRWGRNAIAEESMGFAPGGNALCNWIASKGHSLRYFVDLGLVSEKDGKYRDFFFDRLVIPIKDRRGKIIGFTARVLDDAQPKYLNSKESPIYSKGKSLFGLDVSAKEIMKNELIYIVEGAPDVLRLHSIGVYNVVASLGTAWTEDQFGLLRRFGAGLCFIPDSDRAKTGEDFGAGIKAVIKNGAKAIKSGFTVTVKEIIPGEKDKDPDPDSYITSRHILDAIEEYDFIPWMANKRAAGKDTSADKAKIVGEIAPLLAHVAEPLKAKLYIKQISKILGIPVTFLSSSVNEERHRTEETRKANEKLIDQELYKKYGFFERGNCYYSLADGGEEKLWSNFVMEPLFHIRDQLNPKRLFRITNENGFKEIIEFKQKELISLSDFKQRIEGVGNFIWEGSDKSLGKLKRFLYEKTETAQEVTQLGWNRDGFYAFGNGILCNGQWHDTDEYGIVRLGDLGNYYLPGSSVIYKGNKELFQFERRFVHTKISEVSLRSYVNLLIDVFGFNAKVGICYILATLFKDRVTSVTKNFPILNLFGPKGSGKSELGHSLMSFFIIKNEPANISSSTDAALADIVAQSANALVHLDEYKNTIELPRREFLKGLYDGVGRSRMNMDRDKKREMTRVDCGVCLSGQEMPTIDIALFSRLIFCRFDATEFSIEQKRRFNALAETRDKGCSHLAIEILKHRKKFETDFPAIYKMVLDDFETALHGEVIEDRIYRNWVVILAALRTLEGVLDLPFGYSEMLPECAKAAVKQNSETQANNELGVFWNTLDYFHQSGEVFYDSDYRIKYVKSFRGRGMTEDIVWPDTRPVLYLSTKRVFMLFKQNAKNIGDAKVSLDSLRYYLEHSKEYLGTKYSVRFKNLSNKVETAAVRTTSSGTKEVVPTSRVDWALCFDYKLLSERFGINLEVSTEAFDEDSI